MTGQKRPRGRPRSRLVITPKGHEILAAVAAGSYQFRRPGGARDRRGRFVRQAGFGVLAYVLAAAAALGALWGLYAAVDGRGYARGQAEKQAQWDAANRAAEEEARGRRLAVARELRLSDERRQAAEDLARENETRWKEAVRENRRTGRPLAACEPNLAGLELGAAGEPARPPHAGDDPRPRLRFTWEFVRLYDSAWTGARGEPLYPAPAGDSAAPGPGAAAPYGADELLDVHGENARRFDACRRDYRALIERIVRASRAWDAARPP